MPQLLEQASNPTPVGGPTASSQVRQPSSNRAKAMPSSPRPKTWWQRTQVVVAWTGELVSSMTAPKPKKPIIEIPPRESSIKPKSPDNNGSDHPDSAPDTAKAAATSLYDPSSNLPQAVSIVEAQSSAPVEASALESGTSSNDLSQTEAWPQPPVESEAEHTKTDQPDDAEPGELPP
ncbi:MAG: hypothetical protein HC929_19590 [Leptolyngbyaceae cyanobacterium SM2_5_2]|nr:hypothetical protein [Leptolyngbyaceae cyanobacterium SM2_5_2]